MPQVADLVEMLLQRLVGVIDAELLERVDLERLEAEDVDPAGISPRVSVEVGLLHAANEGLRPAIVRIVLSGIPRQSAAAPRGTLALAAPRSETTSYTFILRCGQFILTTVRPRALVKDSIVVLHNSLAIGPTILVDAAGVMAEVARVIGEWHLLEYWPPLVDKESVGDDSWR
jgi:hypothetical protein